jgi:hypothetical protein
MSTIQDAPAQGTRTVLLPCPFCGGPADFEQITGSGSSFATWSVGCQSSETDCIGYQMLAHYNRKCEAAEAWNKRPTPPSSEPVMWVAFVDSPKGEDEPKRIRAWTSYADRAKQLGETIGREFVPLYAHPQPAGAEREALIERLQSCVEGLEEEAPEPTPYDFYYAVKNEDAHGWSYFAVGIGITDIKQALDALRSTPHSPVRSGLEDAAVERDAILAMLVNATRQRDCFHFGGDVMKNASGNSVFIDATRVDAVIDAIRARAALTGGGK